MKILLINPPWKRFFGSEDPLPPIALHAIASYLKTAPPFSEIDVLNCDYAMRTAGNVYNYDYSAGYRTYRDRLMDSNDPIWLEIHAKIRDYSPDVVGITSMSASYTSSLRVARIVKQINPNTRVVMGGHHVTALPQDTLRQNDVDVVVIGEGELTFRDYLQAGADPRDIEGLAYRNTDGDIIVNNPRATIENLDDLPLPVFDSKITTYDHLNKESWTIVGSRGCPFGCIYCAESNKRVRLRSVDHVINEITTVRNKYGITSFNFGDDVFSLNRKRLLEFCNRLTESNLGVRWTCNNRIDTLDHDILDSMHRANCYELFLGIETGSRRTMELIKKKIDLARCAPAIKLAKAHKFLVHGFFIIGFPWETEDDMRETVDFIGTLGLDDFQLNIATPLPGTEMFKQLVDKGKIVVESMDWSRLYQGSLHMNYSDSYSDAEWARLLMKYVTLANRKLILLQYSLFFKKLFRNPGLAVKLLSPGSFKRYIWPVLRHSFGWLSAN